MDFGIFPFGSPNTQRPIRRCKGAAQLFLLAVYPSALHVRWQRPSSQGQEQGGVRSLAIDVEPEVLWDGRCPAAADLIREWSVRVGFRADWGQITAAAENGSSGMQLIEKVLDPLCVSADDVAMSDCVNHYFLKYRASAAQGRQQGDAIAQEYAPFAARLGLPACTLPTRPDQRQLIARALQDHRTRLLTELSEISAPRLVTVGEEARRVILGLVDTQRDDPPYRSLKASDPSYGQPGSARIDGRSMEWIALVHPNQNAEHWRAANQRWRDQLSTRR